MFSAVLLVHQVPIQWPHTWPCLNQVGYKTKPKVTNLKKGLVGKGVESDERGIMGRGNQSALHTRVKLPKNKLSW